MSYRAPALINVRAWALIVHVLQHARVCNHWMASTLCTLALFRSRLSASTPPDVVASDRFPNFQALLTLGLPRGWWRSEAASLPSLLSHPPHLTLASHLALASSCRLYVQSRPMWLLRRPLLAVVLTWKPLKLLQGRERSQAAGCGWKRIIRGLIGGWARIYLPRSLQLRLLQLTILDSNLK